MDDFILQEKDFEKKVIGFLKDKGFVYLDSLEILSLRGSRSEVILSNNLKKVIQKLNPNIDSVTLKSVVSQIFQVRQASLIVANQKTHEFLVNGIKCKNHKKQKTETIRIVDFDNPDNNEFIVTNQFAMFSDHPEYDNQIPDIVIYLNGLPIVVFELKSPFQSSEGVILKAFEQIQNYQKYLNSLFVFNVLNVISDKHTSKYGSITSAFDRYFVWKQLDKKLSGKTSQSDLFSVFINSLFDHATFLNLLQNYIFFVCNKGSSPSKIIAGYHQYYAVEKVKQSVITHVEKDSQSQSKKAGIFWHTQGSGKSFSMVMLVKNVVNVKKKLTTLVITDRKNLDTQILGVFQKAQGYLWQKIKRIDSIEALTQELKNLTQNGVYLCTVQKFTQEIGKLSNRNDILVITDEAHRSHRNIEESIWKIPKDAKTFVEKFSYSYHLHQAFPSATFIGFTATPIERDDQSTREVFGDYVSKYLITDAEDDGCVVKIYYESRQKKLHIDPEQIDLMDKEAKKIQNKIKEKSALPKVVIKHFNKRIQQFENIIADEDRMNEVTKDFIHHYQERKNVLKGKALFICFNRRTALKYYHKITQVAPELKQHIRVIVTPNYQSDKPEDIDIISPYPNYHQESASQFKDPNSKFKIALVVDMWLTGFDVPCLDVVYVDRPLRKHSLMQAIARVNRVYTDDDNKGLSKKNGFVVDYIGIWQKLKEALEFYGCHSDNDPHAKYTELDIEQTKITLLKLLQEIFTSYLKDLPNIDYNIISTNTEKSRTYAYDVIENIQDTVLKNKCQSQFIEKVKILKTLFSPTLSILSATEKIKVQILLLARGQLIRGEIGSIDLDKDVNYMKQIIEDAIQFNKTIVFDDGPNQGKMSLTDIINYIHQTAFDKKPYLQLARTIVAAKILVSKITEINNIRGGKLSEKLNAQLQRHANDFISLEEWKKFLKSLAKEVTEIEDVAKRLGLTTTALAFYEIIADDQYSQSHYDQKMIKKITLEIFNKVKEELDVSWFYNEGKKQWIRSEVMLSLFKNNYPPDSCQALKKQLTSQLEEHIITNRMQIKGL